MTDNEMPPYIATLHEFVARWAPLGVREYGDGTRLVGHFPDRGIGAYLHHLFGPLSDDLVDAAEQRMGLSFPAELREFYGYHNGCILFDRAMFVFGVRRSYDRADFDAMGCNPFDILVPALTHRALSPSGRGIAICTYEDHSVVLLEPAGEVVRALRDGPVVNVWPSYREWLLSEYRRLERLFDSCGHCLVDALDTPPPHSIS